MKYFFIRTILLALVIIYSDSVNGQVESIPKYPIIGQPLPIFTLTDVNYYSKKKVTNEDLKGKYVLMDFWNKHCISCIKSFPKLNRLQQEFNDSLLIILVGYDDKEIRDVYEPFRNRFKLNLVAAYDTVLFSKPFRPGISGVPWCVWIDPQGVVKAVTGSSDISKDNIQSFINNEPFSFHDDSYNAEQKAEKAYEPTRPLLIDNNGGDTDTSFLYRSLLSVWKPGMGRYNTFTIDEFINLYKVPKVECLGFSLNNLYSLAYFGSRYLPDSIHSKPVMETKIKDSTLFENSIAGDRKYYCYSLIVPREKGTKEKLMKMMQKDLERYFGYTARVEERVVPCLILLSSNDNESGKLRTHGGKKINETSSTGATLINQRVEDVIFSLKYQLNNGLQIIDETGITDNIDIKINAIMSDLDSLNKELARKGLTLIYGERRMKAFVIYDIE